MTVLPSPISDISSGLDPFPTCLLKEVNKVRADDLDLDTGLRLQRGNVTVNIGLICAEDSPLRMLESGPLCGNLGKKECSSCPDPIRDCRG